MTVKKLLAASDMPGTGQNPGAVLEEVGFGGAPELELPVVDGGGDGGEGGFGLAGVSDYVKANKVQVCIAVAVVACVVWYCFYRTPVVKDAPVGPEGLPAAPALRDTVVPVGAEVMPGLAGADFEGNSVGGVVKKGRASAKAQRRGVEKV